jgi:tRNA pseudouridine55 synthase
MSSQQAQLDGLLLVDKPQDLTSHDVVARVRRALKQKSVGHTGTLDPIATGLMILVLGEATRLSEYLIAENKRYEVMARFGVRTDTLDRTGRVLAQQSCSLDAEEIRREAELLEGSFEWPVPLFSATKVHGRRLYEHGREGTEVDLPLKEMRFWDIDVREAWPQSARVALTCSKGGYVRTWVDQLGSNLGVGAVVEELRRLSVGNWSVEQAVTLDRLETGDPGQALISMAQALPGLKSVLAGPREARLVGHGQIPRDVGARLIFEQKQAIETGRPVYVKVVSAEGGLLAILAAEPRQGLKIRRVFRGFP